MAVIGTLYFNNLVQRTLIFVVLKHRKSYLRCSAPTYYDALHLKQGYMSNSLPILRCSAPTDKLGK